MKPSKPVEGEIVLDNQCLQVVIKTPSGCLTIVDKVTGVIWAMDSALGSGAVAVNRDGGEQLYQLGVKGDAGILFEQNFYMVRSTETDDFHDVSLSGAANDGSGLKITIRYLFSSTFPILNCFCYADGEGVEKVSRIEFPIGPTPVTAGTDRIFAPQDLKTIRDQEPSQDVLFEVDPGQEHRIVGAPFYAVVRNDGVHPTSGLLFFLQHPLSRVDIRDTNGSRIATPSSAHLETTGKTEIEPYCVRMQIEPIGDLNALAWLGREQMLKEERQLHL
ncbi:MAG: hypothetical protein P9L94_07090 [Candidatus Hinthialibacter antarcticus]|nr:hypothetical protein [Candidatus Hinthialibacter antarcticus]